jgi:hypothetical protein
VCRSLWRLRPDLANAVLDFTRTRDSGFSGEAIAILAGSGWRLRNQLLPRLEIVAMRHRDAFAKRIRQLGYLKIGSH